MAKRKSVRAFRSLRVPKPVADVDAGGATGDASPVLAAPESTAPEVTRAAPAEDSASGSGKPALGDLVSGALGQGLARAMPESGSQPGAAGQALAIEPQAPSAPQKRQGASITPSAVRALYHHAREAYVELGDFAAAYDLAARASKDWAPVVLEGERIFGRQKPYVARPIHEIERPPEPFYAAPKDERVGEAPETPGVAAARKAWDDAARAGDPGAMTRTANALIRAVTAAKGHAVSHDTSEILTARPGAGGGSVANGSVQSDADVGPGQMAMADDGVRVAAMPQADSDVGRSEIATASGRRHQAASTADLPLERTNEEDQTISQRHAETAAKLIMEAPEERRPQVLREFREHFGDAVTAYVVRQLPKNLVEKSNGGLRAARLDARPYDPSNKPNYSNLSNRTWPEALHDWWSRLAGHSGAPREDAEDDSWLSQFDRPDAPAMGPEVWREPEIFPQGLGPAPTINSQTDPVDPPYQPGAWRHAQMPQSHQGKVLVDAKELSDAQYDNLTGRWNRRRWTSPTSAPMAGDEKLAGTSAYNGGYGYFGAHRNDLMPDRQYHGALDFPRNPNEAVVKMPTQARFIGLLHNAANGYALQFDLGDGIVLTLWHLIPSQEILDLARSNRQDRILAIDHPLGVIDRQRDHVHLQVEVKGGRFNGQHVPGFVIDPTPFFY